MTTTTIKCQAKQKRGKYIAKKRTKATEKKPTRMKGGKTPHSLPESCALSSVSPRSIKNVNPWKYCSLKLKGSRGCGWKDYRQVCLGPRKRGARLKRMEVSGYHLWSLRLLHRKRQSGRWMASHCIEDAWPSWKLLFMCSMNALVYSSREGAFSVSLAGVMVY